MAWVAAEGFSQTARRAEVGAASPARLNRWWVSVSLHSRGPGDGSDHLLRGAYRAALLQPGVPGHADPGELRHLLATQARRASAAEAGNADPLRLDAFPPAAQEGPQLFGAGRLRGAFRSVAGRGVEWHGEVLRRADG
ncbi:Uncharacterised protein [Pseudomonas aeruginosa]|nr:Uncharacterised protein [Pseudomonas aeruginosa]